MRHEAGARRPPPRTIGSVDRAAAVAGVLVLSLRALGCGGVSAPEPSAITKIVISVGRCNQPCPSSQIAITPNNRFTYTDNTPVERTGTIALSEIVRQLLATSFFSGRTNYASSKEWLNTTALYVAYAGKSREVIIDTIGDAPKDLRDFVARPRGSG